MGQAGGINEPSSPTTIPIGRSSSLLAPVYRFQQKCIYLSVAGKVEFVESGMKKAERYLDLEGRQFDLGTLDGDERDLLARLEAYARRPADYSEYANHWLPEVDRFYSARGLTRAEIVETVVFEVAQDIGSRLMVASGEARLPDYRDELETLIRARFRTRREFCEATGLTEDMLSHVLAKRKHLAVDTLSEALGKIGYALHITPLT